MGNPLIIKKGNSKNFQRPENQSAGILDDYAVRKVVSTREGTIEKVPVNDSDIANKKYVDDHIPVETDPVFTAWDKDHDDLSNVTADQHHARYTDAEAVSATSGSYEATGSIATHAAIATAHQDAPGLIATHTAITDAHHTKYTDAEAEAVADTQIATHTAISDAHHIKYTDAEAVSAVATADDYLKNDANDATTGILTALSYVASGSSGTSAEWDTAYTHSQDNTQAHSDYMLNTGDSASGDYNFDSNTLFVDSNNGRVGIGTASPNEKLDVRGAGRFVGGTLTPFSIDRSTGVATDRILFWSVDTEGHIKWHEGGADALAGYGELIFEVDASPGQASNRGGMRFKDGAGGLMFYLDNYDKRAYFSGNVGIGTATPNQKLTIEGTQSLKEQAAANADTAAYGQIWVKNDTPNTLWFTDDAGTDHQIAFV